MLPFWYFQLPLLAALSSLLGYLVWHGEWSLAWLSLLPAVATQLEYRRQVFCWWLGYYAIAAIPAYYCITDYWNSPPFVALLGWMLACLLLALPWVLVSARGGTSFRWAGGGVMGAALCMTLLPPLGVLTIGHPILAAGSLWPGSGFKGLVLLTAVWMLFAMSPPRRRTWLLLALVGLIAAIEVPGGRPLPASGGRVGKVLDTEGAPPATLTGLVAQAVDVLKRLQGHYHEKIMVLPESAVVQWRPATQALLQEQLLKISLDSAIVIGTVLDEGLPLRRNVALIFEKGEQKLFMQRQPLPFVMWAPWSAEHFASHWQEPGVIRIAGHEAAIHICSEEFFLALAYADFAVWKPELIIALANHWWSRHSIVDRMQARHTEAISALFNVPYLRAVNRAVPVR